MRGHTTMSAFVPAISPSLTLPVLHVPIYFLSFFMIGKLRVDAICHDYEFTNIVDLLKHWLIFNTKPFENQ